MNIQIQLCGMLILVLLYAFYRSNKSLQLYTERIFHITMRTAIVSLFLDMLSIVAIVNRHKMPLMLANGVCKSYIITLIWLTMWAFNYVLTDLFTEKKHRKVTRNMIWITVFQSIGVSILPIHIYEQGKAVYTYGPAVLWVYACVGIHMVSTFAVIFRYFKKMNKRRMIAIGLWMFIWILAAGIQFINNEWLIVGFASAIGILILFVVIENPEASIDRKLGCFNSYALTEYIKFLLEDEKEYGLLEVSLGNPEVLQEYHIDVETIMKKILSLSKKYSDTKSFKNINSNLFVIGQDRKRLKLLGEDILKVLAEYDVLRRESMVVLLQNMDDFGRINDVFHFLTFIRNRYFHEKSTVFVADDQIVMKFRERYMVEAQIEEALKEDRVEVFYQPIFSTEESSFTSAEALMRIRQKNGELLSPGIFVPIAEQSGLIVELGDRVFEKVCEFLKNKELFELGLHYIEVNLSVVQCERKDLAERLISIIEKYGVSPSQINLEITETASIQAKAILEENMQKLIEYGFTFSLDDFGKGESNLMYMVEMPVSILKFDMDMSKAFFYSDKARHVVRAVVDMAHGMNIKLVAEGIETKEENENICREGIDYIQGYYYSKPLPQDEFFKFVKQNHC